MRQVLGWTALVAVALAIKLLFVDRYFPRPPGNILIWLPIAAVLCVAVVGAVTAYTLLKGRHRRD